MREIVYKENGWWAKAQKIVDVSNSVIFIASSVTQVWSITLHFIHHPWDNWLTKRRFLWIFITPGNTSIANQNAANIALLSSAEDSFVLLPLLKITQENPINVFVSNQYHAWIATNNMIGYSQNKHRTISYLRSTPDKNRLKLLMEILRSPIICPH